MHLPTTVHRLVLIGCVALGFLSQEATAATLGEPLSAPPPEAAAKPEAHEAQRWRDALPPTILGAHVAAAGANVAIVEVDRDPTLDGAPAALVAEQLQTSGTAGNVRVVLTVDRGEAQSDAEIVEAVAQEHTARVVLLRMAQVDGEPRMSILVYESQGDLVSAVTASPGVPIPRPPDQGVPRAIEVDMKEPPPPPNPAARSEVAESRTSRVAKSRTSRAALSDSTIAHRRNAHIGLVVVGTVLAAGGIAAVIGGLSACEPGCDPRRKAVAGGAVLTIMGSGLVFGGFALKPAPRSRSTVRRSEQRRVQVATSVFGEQLGLHLAGRF